MNKKLYETPSLDTLELSRGGSLILCSGGELLGNPGEPGAELDELDPLIFN